MSRVFDDIYFITNNQVKQMDFEQLNIKSASQREEKPEILSADVGLVAMYKALDANMNNILVEDTSLNVDGVPYLGTEIKYTYDLIKDDMSYHGRNAVWETAICCVKDDILYIARGRLAGVLKYPKSDDGYHFEQVFAVQQKNQFIHFSSLSVQEKSLIHPRHQAVRKLESSILRNDFSRINVINRKDIQPWHGEYQEPNFPKKSLKMR